MLGRLTMMTAAVALMMGCGGSELEGEEQLPEVTASPEEGAVRAQGCFTINMGTATSCKSADTWRQYLKDSCEAQGGTLGGSVASVACSGGYRYASGGCCN